jgi:CheY-like chemotaxis protein
LGEAVSAVAYDEISVLLVDDNSFARGVGQRVLRSAGVVSIQQASSGQEALDLIGQPSRVVDVVFCDLMMPDMDGIQMIRRVASLATPPAVVFLSGANAALLHTAEDAGRARGLRILGVIKKPLTPDAVRRVLARLGDAPIANNRGTAVEATSR